MVSFIRLGFYATSVSGLHPEGRHVEKCDWKCVIGCHWTAEGSTDLAPGLVNPFFGRSLVKWRRPMCFFHADVFYSGVWFLLKFSCILE